MANLTQAVGRGMANRNASDVKLIQQLLNQHRRPPFTQLPINGVAGTDTIAAIEEFQRRVVKMVHPDGRVDPGGTTFRLLSQSPGSGVATSPGKDFSHPDAVKVTLKYGEHAVKLNQRAEQLMKSILAASGYVNGTLNSTLRTYHDQARITLNETYKNNPTTVSTWYGAEVLQACKDHQGDIQGLAEWWKAHDQKRGKVSSKHLSNHAMDVVPGGDRSKFVAKVKELIKQHGSGVQRIIPKGEMNEPVDHVEFTFEVT